MTTVTIEEDVIRISMEGMGKVWALKSGLTIPLAHVRAVQVAPADLRPKGIRAPGTALPGVFYAGTWRGRGFKEFWYVHRPEKALVLELEGDAYSRVAVEVGDPHAVAAEIEGARAGLAGTVR